MSQRMSPSGRNRRYSISNVCDSGRARSMRFVDIVSIFRMYPREKQFTGQAARPAQS